jgi:hypothetical protein
MKTAAEWHGSEPTWDQKIHEQELQKAKDRVSERLRLEMGEAKRDMLPMRKKLELFG